MIRSRHFPSGCQVHQPLWREARQNSVLEPFYVRRPRNWPVLTYSSKSNGSFIYCSDAVNHLLEQDGGISSYVRLSAGIVGPPSSLGRLIHISVRDTWCHRSPAGVETGISTYHRQSRRARLLAHFFPNFSPLLVPPRKHDRFFRISKHAPCRACHGECDLARWCRWICALLCNKNPYVSHF